MGISMMVSQLKQEVAPIDQSLTDKKVELNRLKLTIGALEMEIKRLNDKSTALHMAIDALDLVSDEPPAEKKVSTPPAEKSSTHHTSYSRKPKRIGKFDPKGQKIGEYASLNQCASAFGWTNCSMKKYIENTGKEKQIRLRGYYLEYLAA